MNKKFLIFILPLAVLVLATIIQLFANHGLYNASLYASKVEDELGDLKFPLPDLEGGRVSNVVDGHKKTFWQGIDVYRQRDVINISWEKTITPREIKIYFNKKRYGTDLEIETATEKIEISGNTAPIFSYLLKSAEIGSISLKIKGVSIDDKVPMIQEVVILAKSPNILISFWFTLIGLFKQYWIGLIFYFLTASILIMLKKELAYSK